MAPSFLYKATPVTLADRATAVRIHPPSVCRADKESGQKIAKIGRVREVNSNRTGDDDFLIRKGGLKLES